MPLIEAYLWELCSSLQFFGCGRVQVLQKVMLLVYRRQ